MSELDRYFDQEIRAIATESKAIARSAAEELRKEVLRQIRQNFSNPSAAFLAGIKIYEFENAAIVRLSPLLSAHAQTNAITGNPNIWILLPDGARLGFKRLNSQGFTWDVLKRRYGSRLAFVPVRDGHVVLYRSSNGTLPIYKIQRQVQTNPKIVFYKAAEEIGQKLGMEEY